MSSELSRTELSCLITHKKGFAFKSKDYIPSGVPVVRVSNFTWDSISTDDLRYVSHEVASSTKVVQLNEYDVIVATVGSWPQNPDSIVGKVVRVPCPLSGALLNQNTVRLRVNDDNLVNQKYLYIALKTKEFSDHLISKAQGSANQASITLSDIFSYAIPWGTYTQRKYIVNVIDSINDKIVIANQINQTLEQMAQALFKSWFVDFEPVKAKMAVLEAGGSQEDATLAAMAAISGKDTDALVVFEREHPEHYAELKATAELFPSAMQEGELGATPTGWKLGCIGDISHRIRTKVGSTSAVVLSAIASGDLVPSDEHFTKQVYSKSIEKYILVEQWSFAYNPSRINIGSIGLNVRNVNGAVSPVYVVFKTEQEYKWYVEILTKTTYFKNNVNILASGSVRQSLSYDDLSSIPLCIPDVSIVNVFNEKYEVYLTFIEQYRNQNNTLISIRDTLLPKLLSGEITLPEAEQAVSEAENV
ncbi:restriction endonuclease subunit S [Enterobacter asburiae]|uniref:restriction endonuclease subunit S n=2 Tax=Enterobacter asburiae TaxID=61645 RepID=UPI001CD41616|nr:restriction endonuclease subunit S [Enterobacter asburiae]